MIAQRPVLHPASAGRRGRPPTPLEPSASAAARLGAELRRQRTAHDLTLTGFGVRIGYSAQYISQVEHGRNTPSEAFVQACDTELGGADALMRLLPAVILEQAQHRSARVAARRATNLSADQEDDVDPINRRELAAAGAAAGLRLGVACAPMSDVRIAETGLRTAHAGAHTRALCTVRAAHAHANLGNTDATERLLAKAHELANQDSAAPPLSVSAALSEHVVRCWEARCWAALSPAKAVALYDGVLRAWPRHRTRDGGLYLARLAIACADAGELDRARAEGRKALAIARTTRSSVAARELKQLAAVLDT
jgi:transcriptional regulator with XRE-family HTH domain